MYCRFRHNVGIQAVAKVDRVDVITKPAISQAFVMQRYRSLFEVEKMYCSPF